MVNSSDFAKRLEKLFEYYDLNASSFAEKIDVGRASISHLLSERNKPSLDFVMKVVKTFPEVELYWLLNGKGNFPKQAQPKIEKPAKEISTTTPLTANKQTKTPQNFSSENNIMKTEQVSSKKEIQRIVIFYTDGTFEAFNHS